MSSASVTQLVYGVHSSAFKSLENRFKVYWREPVTAESRHGRLLDHLAFPTERMANAEAARLNGLVRACATEGCKGTVYPHEVELREGGAAGDVCDRCFRRMYEAAAAAGQGRAATR